MSEPEVTPELVLLRAENEILRQEVRMLSGCLIASGAFGLPAQIHADLWGSDE